MHMTRATRLIAAASAVVGGWVDDDDDDDDVVVVVVITVLHTDETNRNRGQQIQQSREGRLCTNEGCFGWHSDNESRMATSISIAQE
jgi:protein involved in temperature-dependent protein secretion